MRETIHVNRNDGTSAQKWKPMERASHKGKGKDRDIVMR